MASANIPSFKIRTPDQPQFIFDQVQTTGEDGPLATVPHRHDYYIVNILLDGEAVHNVDFTDYEVKAPAIMLLDLDQVHVHRSLPGCTVAYVCFTRDFLLHYNNSDDWQQLFRQPWLPLQPEQLQVLKGYLQLISHTHQQNGERRDVILKDLVHALLTYCVQIAAHTGLPPAPNAATQLYRQFRQLLNEHFLTDAQVAQYAARLFVTPGHLNVTVKKLSGYNAKQLIDERRLMEAKRMLYWEDVPVKEISWQLHFEDEGYFTRFFKKQTGLTPMTFRKQLHGKYN